MTPLHLAVWHSLRAEEFLAVKTLLEHNADCSAKDNVLNFISIFVVVKYLFGQIIVDA
jgi:hypothetical protein